jgi:hypothetical protein
MRLSLQNRFLLPTLSLMVLGMAILTFISYENSRQAIEQATKQQLVGGLGPKNGNFKAKIEKKREVPLLT